MVEFNKKKTYRKYIYSPISLILLFIIAIIFIKAFIGVAQKERISSEYLERERSELVRLKNRQESLTKSVEYLKTDKGVEAELRSKFRMVKEGESVAVIVDDETEKLATTTSSQREYGFFSSILNWFR